MTAEPGPVLLVGCGKMGGALLAGWRAQIPELRVEVIETDPSLRDRAVRDFNVSAFAPAKGMRALPKASAVVLAVKPQTMDEVAPDYRPLADKGALILSIAAGRTVASLSKHLGEGAAIVRAMPNTPAAIGKGMTVAYAGMSVTEAQRRLAERLLAAAGKVAWIDSEDLMDAVTAVSGSGPAYVFLLAECLARAGEEAGLPGDLAMRLARETVAGAGALLGESDATAEELRRVVTSPGGTTAAALDVLMGKDGLAALLTRAVVAAARRSRELAS